MRSPFFGLAVAAAAGIILAELNANFILLAGLIGIALAALSWRWPSTASALLLVALAFYAIQSLRSPERFAAVRAKPLQVATVTGRVVTEPKADTRGGQSFLLQVSQIRLDQLRSELTSERVLARWRGTVEIGDTLMLFGTLEQIAPPRNPGEFDMRAYLQRQGVNRTFVVRYPENGHVVWQGSRFNILRLAATARNWMQQTLSLGLRDSPDVVGLICGTSLGLRHETAQDIEEPFQQTGTLHLFAVAGLHVGIVAALLWTVASVLRLPRKLATALIIPLLFFYAAITGLHTASIRAALMGSILLGGIFFDRKVFALNSLAAAAFLILLFDSNQLFTSGFQLSFCVVGSIILLTDGISRALQRVVEPDPFLPRELLSGWRRFSFLTLDRLARASAVSLAAWIGSLLLIYWYFHVITPVSVVANLAIVPLAYFVLALSLLSLVTAPVALSIYFNNANWLLSKVILALVHGFASLPDSHFYLAPLDDRTGPISFTVLDEGTGAALHFRARGYDWLIDCGNARSYERTLKQFLHARGINKLEGLILTHGDAQHLGAASQLLADYNPRELYLNPLDVRSRTLHQLRDSLGAQSRTLSRGDQLVLGPDVTMEILYPPRDLSVKSADDGPIIARIATDDAILLLESDAGAEAEEALLAAGDDLRSDILIKGQHHRGGSGTPAFLDAVKPTLVIATSRENPINERIAPEFISALRERGIRLFSQDIAGAVTVEILPEHYRAHSFMNGETFESSTR